MTRLVVTEKIFATKISKGITWESVAKKVGLSKEWTTALCLGQMTANPAQAKVLGKIFSLTVEEQKWLQVVPYKGSLPSAVPTDQREREILRGDTGLQLSVEADAHRPWTLHTQSARCQRVLGLRRADTPGH